MCPVDTRGTYPSLYTSPAAAAHEPAMPPPPPVWSLVPWCRALAAHHRRAYDAARARALIPRRHDLYTPARLAELPSEGDRLLKGLRDALHFFDGIGYTRSTHQREFHSSMMAACVRHIYKDEFSENFVRILQENGWDEARQEVMICCPRRFGKTFAVGMYIAAYLYVIPCCEVCVFSPSRRQSEKMLELITTFLRKLPGASERIMKKNRERLWMRGDAHRAEDVRKVSSYPSKGTYRCAPMRAALTRGSTRRRRRPRTPRGRGRSRGTARRRRGAPAGTSRAWRRGARGTPRRPP